MGVEGAIFDGAQNLVAARLALPTSPPTFTLVIGHLVWRRRAGGGAGGGGGGSGGGGGGGGTNKQREAGGGGGGATRRGIGV
jgi:hypothetical protein